MKEIDAVRLLDKASASFFLHFSLVSYPNSRQVFFTSYFITKKYNDPTRWIFWQHWFLLSNFSELIKIDKWFSILTRLQNNDHDFKSLTTATDRRVRNAAKDCQEKEVGQEKSELFLLLPTAFLLCLKSSVNSDWTLKSSSRNAIQTWDFVIFWSTKLKLAWNAS